MLRSATPCAWGSNLMGCNPTCGLQVLDSPLLLKNKAAPSQLALLAGIQPKDKAPPGPAAPAAPAAFASPAEAATAAAAAAAVAAAQQEQQLGLLATQRDAAAAE